MGQFANTLFSMLLGWVQTAASWLWALVSGEAAAEGLAWALEHWLLLAGAACLGCMLVDFLVYLLRWQPYRVWGRFLRRERNGQEEESTGGQVIFQRKWLYADGSTQVEDVRHQEPEVPLQPSEPLTAPIRPTRRMARRISQEQGYNAPVYPPQWQYEHQSQDEKA